MGRYVYPKIKPAPPQEVTSPLEPILAPLRDELLYLRGIVSQGLGSELVTLRAEVAHLRATVEQQDVQIQRLVNRADPLVVADARAVVVAKRNLDRAYTTPKRRALEVALQRLCERL